MRQLRDEAGTQWTVSEVRPEHTLNDRGKLLPESHRRGWLCFESRIEKRRLTPFPRDWLDMAERDLDALCRQAVRVTRTPMRIRP